MRHAIPTLLLCCCCALAQPPDTKAEQANLKEREDAALRLAASAKRIGNAAAEAKANATAADFREKRLKLVAAETAHADALKAESDRQAAAEKAARDADAAKAVASGGIAVGFILFWVVVLILVVLVWLAPIVIAMLRGHPDMVAISAVCALFGCTFIGWGVALVWSLKAFDADRDYR